jgi:N-acylneuraminate cytidylyltransferase
MRLVAGRPLIDYTIATARASRGLTQICLTSEDPAILDYARHASIETVERPREMSGAAVHASVPILHALECLGGGDAFDYCVMLLPTFPLRRPETIDAVVTLSVERRDNVLSLTQLNKSMHHFRVLTAGGRARHITPDKAMNFQSQDFPLLYAINGCCYCAPVERLLQERSFHYGDPIAYVTDGLDAWDIDTEDDLRTAEALLEARK